MYDDVVYNTVYNANYYVQQYSVRYRVQCDVQWKVNTICLRHIYQWFIRILSSISTPRFPYLLHMYNDAVYNKAYNTVYNVANNAMLTTMMSVHRKWIIQYWNLLEIYLLLFIDMYSYLNFCIENLSFTLFLFQKRKREVCCPLPLHKKNTTKWCTFTKCVGGSSSSILYRDSSKLNLNPATIVNWIMTQFRIRGKYRIEFREGWSNITRP